MKNGTWALTFRNQGGTCRVGTKHLALHPVASWTRVRQAGPLSNWLQEGRGSARSRGHVGSTVEAQLCCSCEPGGGAYSQGGGAAGDGGLHSGLHKGLRGGLHQGLGRGLHQGLHGGLDGHLRGGHGRGHGQQGSCTQGMDRREDGPQDLSDGREGEASRGSGAGRACIAVQCIRRDQHTSGSQVPLRRGGAAPPSAASRATTPISGRVNAGRICASSGLKVRGCAAPRN